MITKRNNWLFQDKVITNKKLSKSATVDDLIDLIEMVLKSKKLPTAGFSKFLPPNKQYLIDYLYHINPLHD